jgi:hypothetical protein
MFPAAYVPDSYVLDSEVMGVTVSREATHMQLLPLRALGPTPLRDARTRITEVSASGSARRTADQGVEQLSLCAPAQVELIPAGMASTICRFAVRNT